jgi:flotillin
MSATLLVIIVVLLGFAVTGFLTFTRLIEICQPNEVLIFSGGSRVISDGRGGQRDKRVGYMIIIGGRKMRIPLLERVDRLDLTNMIIDISAHNAYSKGGIPLTVQGVANIKIASQEPVLNNAIERFLGVRRAEIMKIAKATLEGSLRGVLATMTPEEVNEDKLLFAERMVTDAEVDMAKLGLAIDNVKVQNVQDDVKYLDSIGRKQSAEIFRTSRIAEAIAQADSVVRSAENHEKEAKAQIDAAIDIAKADAQKRYTDAVTKRPALVAEEMAVVAAAVAQATAEIDVQNARLEQVRRKLDADVIQPAKAALAAAEATAKADASPIIENGKAGADVLKTLAASWRAAGKNAKDVFLLQKLNSVITTLTSTISDARIANLTMIDARSPTLSQDGSLPVRALSTLEQVKQIFGVDLVQKMGGSTSTDLPPPITPATEG